MKLNLIGPFVVNAPFGTEIAFAKGLRELGHEVIEVDPNLGSDVYRGMGILSKRADATVVFKTACGQEDYLEDLAHPVVVYQPDDARFAHIRQMMLMMRQYSSLFLSFDSHGADVAKTMGYRAAETLLLTADPDLYSPGSHDVVRDIDVSFIGSLGDPIAHSSRRKMCEIVHQIGHERGWNMVFEQTQDTARIVDVYRRSKIVLNHATDVGQDFGSGFGLQCRHFEVGMTRTPLLSNALLNREVLGNEPFPFFAFHGEDDLRDGIVNLVESDAARTTVGDAFFEVIQRGHLPRHRAEQLVDFIQRNA